MSEWWTYSLSDFLLFSPRTYYRLLELYNVAILPAQIVALASGAVILFLLRDGATKGRIVVVILAALWLFTAWAWHWQRYATINWAASYFAIAFAFEALLLLWIGLIRGALAFRPKAETVSRLGLGLFLFALIVQPLIAPVLGREWMQIELFGVAPDPTAVATLGLLLAAARTSWVLLIVPLAWCVISGATLWAMNSPDALVMPLAAAIVLILAVSRSLRPKAETSM
jgi:hypothetical protein